jgi:hypothetical protein
MPFTIPPSPPPRYLTNPPQFAIHPNGRNFLPRPTPRLQSRHRLLAPSLHRRRDPLLRARRRLPPRPRDIPTHTLSRPHPPLNQSPRPQSQSCLTHNLSRALLFPRPLLTRAHFPQIPGPDLQYRRIPRPPVNQRLQRRQVRGTRALEVAAGSPPRARYSRESDRAVGYPYAHDRPLP